MIFKDGEYALWIKWLHLSPVRLAAFWTRQETGPRRDTAIDGLPLFADALSSTVDCDETVMTVDSIPRAPAGGRVLFFTDAPALPNRRKPPGERAGVPHSLRARDFTAAKFRDKSDNGRKAAILLLECFDRHGIAIRRGVTRMRFFEIIDFGGEALPVGRLAFKAREGRQTALSGFDSHSLPPILVRDDQRRVATLF